jgi:hypothetical protein
MIFVPRVAKPKNKGSHATHGHRSVECAKFSIQIGVPRTALVNARRIFTVFPRWASGKPHDGVAQNEIVAQGTSGMKERQVHSSEWTNLARHHD